MSGHGCQVPPPGWVCTRAAGHDGPCAAVEAPDDARAEFFRLDAQKEEAVQLMQEIVYDLMVSRGSEHPHSYDPDIEYLAPALVIFGNRWTATGGQHS